MTEPFTIKLAGKYIRIMPMYEMIREYCKDYIVADAETADLFVKTVAEDIIHEKIYSQRAGHGNVMCNYEDYLETLAVYRKIAEWMPMQNTVLFHGSVIAVDGHGYLFTARSGIGKSTHAGLWREYFGERAVMVNDDKPLLQLSEDGFYAFGTPWNGKHGLGNNMSVPLDAICILKRGNENKIYRITSREAYPMLLQQCYRPTGTRELRQTLRVIDLLMDRVSFYRLFCNMDTEAAGVAYRGMISNKGRNDL